MPPVSPPFRLIKDASSSIQGYMEIKEHGRVHPSTRPEMSPYEREMPPYERDPHMTPHGARLDHRKRDLVLREGIGGHQGPWQGCSFVAVG